MNQYFKFEDENLKKTNVFCDSVIDAVIVTRYITTICEEKTKELTEAMKSNDKERMKNTLQVYIQKNRALIEKSGYLKVIYIKREEYDQLSIEDVKHQLYMMKGLIYLNEVTHCAAKETIKNRIKKNLKASGVFSENEIKNLLVTIINLFLRSLYFSDDLAYYIFCFIVHIRRI